ncbi:hypothetical protein MSAN_02438100 [Mycena sanguinolenta]|uniref:Uncharacterized protein n=1 Tax=Mycena sanguinolenta TaxID=230812 RepID=A0A8H7CB52_9AGAR|nr:hypothetical protein MSAN_02438100 [Mycena sanguinolenta]
MQRRANSKLGAGVRALICYTLSHTFLPALILAPSSCGTLAGMCCFQSLPRLFRRVRKSSTRTSPPARKLSHSDSEEPQQEPQPKTNAETARTAMNMLKFALKELGNISSNIPMGGILSGVIAPLLDITERIQQTSNNAEGLVQLALRIEHLTPIVTQMAGNDPQKGQGIVEKLQKELESITTELGAARSRGKLNQFFNSVDNASILDKHNTALDRLIADCTLNTVQEIAESFRERSELKMQEFYPGRISTVGNITGGIGGKGGDGRTGGEGGPGEGPQIDADEQVKIGNVSGGTGGAGGTGIDVGGKGGPGKAPVLNLRRNRVSLKAEPQAEEDSIL